MGWLSELLYYVTLPFQAMNSVFSGLPGLRSLGRISVAARIAWLVFLFLLIILVSFLIAFRFDESAAQTENYMPFKNIIIIAVLMIVIPIVSYYVVKLWMQGDVSAFPEIDKAWKQGIDALDAHGLSLNNTPVFLILGNADDKRAENLMKASGFSMNVDNPAEGPAELHWYANPEAIYIFCTGVSCLSRLSHKFQNIGPSDRSAFAGGSAPNQPPIMGGQTIVAGSGEESLLAADDGTEVADDEEQQFMAPPSGAPAIGATMDFGADGGIMQTMQFSQGPQEHIQASSSKVGISASELTDNMEKLEYVCDLLIKDRQPVCPLNGILVMMPFEMIEGVSDQIQRAVHSDLETIRNKTQLRCSVTALVTEMESHPGFQELIRRVGLKRSKEQRFGKGFNLWNPPIAEQMEAVGKHACGAFEDWAYMLFRERDGLRRPGNPKLFSLLCKVRGVFSEQLSNVLANSFGYEPDKDPRSAGSALLFSGCYFAATGATDDRQAFVRSVLYKMMQQDGELDWNEDALAKDQQADNLANFASLIAGVGFLAIVGFFIYQYLNGQAP
ncbi:MAG: hypothetical protein COA78_38380 [Blastopirellula sp.]|nr:MAG: hypothetical protein COA78_38380 [Blastopirellula sp.]